MPRLTIKDIARLAGVAPITVSRVINNKPDVSVATSRRVRDVIDEHHWLPNLQARGLVGGRTYTLGFLTMGQNSSFVPDLLHAAEEVAAEYQYGLLVVSASRELTRAQRALRALLQRGVDGIVLGGPLALTDDDLARVAEAGIPMVTLYDQRKGVPMFGIDYREPGKLAAEHLYRLGHRSCLYVHDSFPLDFDAFTHARWIGFRDWPAPDFRREPLHLSYGTCEALCERLQRGDITGVFCQNDNCLPDVYRACWELGIAVPRDLSVIGCNDQPISRQLSPRVSSIDGAKERVVRAAVTALIHAADGARARGHLFSPAFVDRESTSSPHHHQEPSTP